MIGHLPKFLIVNKKKYKIRSDYRNILQIFQMFNDPDLFQEEKWIVAVYLLYKDFACAKDVYRAIESDFEFEEAIKQMIWFISAGTPEKDIMTEEPLYDWKQDEQIIFSAVNEVAGKEVRRLHYMHWWTFLGYFREIRHGDFAFIVGIRNKINKGKKLSKEEKEFLKRNKEIIKLRPHKTKEQIQEEAENKALLDEIL